MLANVPRIVFWFTMLSVSAVSLTLGNKYILTQWEHEGSLLAIQSLFAIVLLMGGDVLQRILGVGQPMKPLRCKQFGVYMLASLFLTLQLITSLLGLPLVTIATVTVFNNLRTLCLAVSECILLRELFSRRVVAALALTVVASTVYGVADAKGGDFSALGYVWMVANMGAAVLAALVYRYFNPSIAQTGAGIALIENINMLPVFLIMAGVMDFTQPDLIPSLIKGGPYLWICILGTSLSGAVIGMAYANCYKLAAATSVAVAATVNKVVAIALGLHIFHHSLSLLEWGAIAFVIIGGIWFAYERKRQSDGAKESAASDIARAQIHADEMEVARRVEMIEIGVDLDLSYDDDDDDDDDDSLEERGLLNT